MLKDLLMQLKLSVNRCDSRAMLYYHLGRVHGFSYSFAYDDIVATGSKNEANFLVNDYALRHGSK